MTHIKYFIIFVSLIVSYNAKSENTNLKYSPIRRCILPLVNPIVIDDKPSLVGLFTKMIIYKTTNLVNGKIYIGRDKKNNPQYIGSGTYIRRAINKYGRNNFKKEIIEFCGDVASLNEREIFWINEFNSRDSKVGYNIARGGDGGVGNHGANKGKKHKEETRQKMRDAAKLKDYNRAYSEERNKKISDSKIGVPRTEETKKKISDKLIGRKIPQDVVDRVAKSNTGKKRTDEFKNGQRIRFMGNDYGKLQSNETREKKSKRWLGKNNPNYGGLSDEHRMNISKSMIGKSHPHTEKTKQKMSKSAKKRWKNIKKNKLKKP